MIEYSRKVIGLFGVKVVVEVAQKEGADKCADVEEDGDCRFVVGVVVGGKVCGHP